MCYTIKYMDLFTKLIAIAKKEPTKFEVFRDALSLCKNVLAKDRKKGLFYTFQLKQAVNETIKKGINVAMMYNFYFNILVAETPYSLDSYFQALEYDRPAKSRFYLPRRKQLLPLVRDLEALLITDELDELFTSQPPRTGKTTTALFVVSWIIGMTPDLANLYCSCSTGLCNAFYKGVYEILTDNTTYNWWKIFPTIKFDKNSFTNAKETYLDTGKVKRYHSFTGRSIDAENLNGSCDCSGLLIGDDLCSGIEEALNPTRLKALWFKVNNNLMSRAKMGAKIWWIGTRWSKADPIGVRRSILESGNIEISNIRYKVRNMPALNENDESNFDYMYGVGFSTEKYKQSRSGFELTDDTASWLAQYQGEPIERSGQLFAPENMNFYDTLPTDKDGKTLEPDRIFAFCDVAFGGGDYLSFPVAYQYGKTYYIEDWIFDNGDKDTTRPRVIDAILRHKIQASRFEANNGGEDYQIKVAEILTKEHGYNHNITSRYAPSTTRKEIRIFDKAPDIKKYFFFKSPSKRDSDYRRAMENLHSYQIMQNDKHKKDDAPDSLSGLCDMAQETRQSAMHEIIRRPF